MGPEGEEAQMFCCNLNNGRIDKLNQKIREDSLLDLGDILILSNVPEKHFTQNISDLYVNIYLKPCSGLAKQDDQPLASHLALKTSESSLLRNVIK